MTCETQELGYLLDVFKRKELMPIGEVETSGLVALGVHSYTFPTSRNSSILVYRAVADPIITKTPGEHYIVEGTNVGDICAYYTAPSWLSRKFFGKLHPSLDFQAERVHESSFVKLLNGSKLVAPVYHKQQVLS